MVGILIDENYKYENVVLEGGEKVTANNVTIQEGKVVRVENGNVTIKEEEKTQNFTFSIYNYGVDGRKTYNLSNVPENVDGQAIVKEFVDFVENDVVS